MSSISVLGLGAMGSRMACRLAHAGHELCLWNRTPKTLSEFAGFRASVFATPREAVAHADLVLSMVRDDEAARSVWLDPVQGALAGVKRGAIILECSTISPAWAKQLHARAGDVGAAALDAPVLGSRLQAEAGQLIFLAGGSPDALASVRSTLLCMGSSVQHVGIAGAGASLKLALNTLLIAQTAALAEFLSIARNSGVDTDRALTVLGETPLASISAMAAGNLLRSGITSPLFSLQLAEKDMGYAQALCVEPLPVMSTVRALLQEALRRGWGDENVTAVAKLLP